MTVDATLNPQQANLMLAGALAEDTSAPAAQAPMPLIQAPPDRHVRLLAGVVNPLEGTAERDAVVRELTGADEEALASPSLSRSMSKYLQTLVARGTESIGGQKVTKDMLDGLLIGDRELLLLGIRKATFGNEIELRTTCPHCRDVDEDFVYDLNDVEIVELDSLEDAIVGIEVTVPSGKVIEMGLSRAGDQDALLEAEGKNDGELNTMMLARVVHKIDGEMPLSAAASVRALSLGDRRELQKQLTERTPGPRIGEAKRTCRACEQEFELGLGLLDIFRA